MKKILLISSLVILGSFSLGAYVGHSQAAADSFSSIKNRDEGKPSDVDFALFWEVWNTLNDKYVATHGTTTIPVTDQEKVYGAIQGLTDSLGDPYTVFFPPEEAKAFEEEISGNFEGVGMEIGLKEDILTVIAPLKGTPAESAGIKAGDKILKIDNTLTSGMSTDEAIKLIRGKKGTIVTFTIERSEGEPFEVKVTRDVINVPTLSTKKLENGIFLIQLYSFTADSPNLFRNALREFMLSKSDKLILDLRGNPGGYLNAAVDMASFFLPQGKVVVREDYGGEKGESTIKSKGYNIFTDKLKFVILVDGGSASASEILAGALHEYGKATLIGEKTFGKGSVQEVIPITSDTSLKVTVARWLTPNGVSISDNGIMPDIVVPISQEDIKAKKDPQLDRAIAELLK
jgi:carboxyl-terminal processing protease